jgi:hypothetical protein
MAKNTNSAKKQLKVKDQPKAARKMTAKELKKVRGGGDYDGDGDVGSADFLSAPKPKIIKKVR